jgi:hypothetical protein
MIRMLVRFGFSTLVLGAVLAAGVAPAAAWSPSAVGLACAGLRGSGPRHVAIAGNFLGGRPVRDGIVDRKSFQACFSNVDRCEMWLAGKARQFPLAPGISSCRAVVLR